MILLLNVINVEHSYFKFQMKKIDKRLYLKYLKDYMNFHLIYY